MIRRTFRRRRRVIGGSVYRKRLARGYTRKRTRGKGTYYGPYSHRSYYNHPIVSQPMSIQQDDLPIADDIGRVAGKGISKFLRAVGLGDYKISKNSLLSGGMSPPEMVNSIKSGGTIIRHREFIQDIYGSTGFQNITFDINPGLVTTFPWASSVCQAYELYRMRGLIFEFKTTSADNVLSSSASTSLGVVALATQYNSLAAPFTSMEQLLNHEFSNSAKPSLSFMHGVECKRSMIPNSELYIRTGPVESGADIRLYDIGQLNCAVSGQQQSSGIIGQLWVTFELELFQERFVGGGLQGVGSFYQLTHGAVTAHPYGSTGPLGVSYDSIGVNLNLNTNTFTFLNKPKVGTYMISIQHSISSSTGGIGPAPVFTKSADLVLLQAWSNATQPQQNLVGMNSGGIAAGDLQCGWCWIVQFNGLDVPLSFLTAASIPSMSATVSFTDIFITQVDDKLISTLNFPTS